MAATSSDSSRRSIFKSLAAATAALGAGLFGSSRTAAAAPATAPAPGGIVTIPDPAQQAAAKGPLFSGAKIHNGLVYIAGKGYHEPGDITLHTTKVLDAVQAELEKAGSSMDKVLKVNVYLADLADYDAMNAAYRGRFGANPPVRTTVACYGGIPGRSLVEIDCIATL